MDARILETSAMKRTSNVCGLLDISIYSSYYDNLSQGAI